MVRCAAIGELNAMFRLSELKSVCRHNSYTRIQIVSATPGHDWGDCGKKGKLNRPGFPGEYFICELRPPDHCFRWKHNKLFLLLPEEYGPAFPAIVDCYTSPPTLVWPAPLLSGFSSSYCVLPPLCKDH